MKSPCRPWLGVHAFKLKRSIEESQSLQDTVPNQEIGNRQIVYYLPSVAGAGAVVVVEVDSSVLVAAGSPVGADGVTVEVLEVDSWVLVAAGSSALLQPANNAKVTKPVAIIALVFIVVSYILCFVWGLFTRKISR